MQTLFHLFEGAINEWWLNATSHLHTGMKVLSDSQRIVAQKDYQKHEACFSGLTK